MRWISEVRERARGLLRREREDAEMDEEMRFHLEMEAERLQRERGLSLAEARRQAAIAFGGVQTHREEVRGARGLAWVPGVSLDLRLGLRMMAKHPGLTAAGVLGMAVAIAVGAGVFSVTSTLIDPSLPLEDGERIVAIRNFDVARNDEARQTHLHDLPTWREELRAVREFGAYREVDRNLIAPDGTAEPLRTIEMTASGFRIARVPPLLGRTLVDEDEAAGAPPVAVIGEEVWRRRFAGDPAIVGRTVRLGTILHTVVGVMPEGFAFPVNNRVWTALRLDPSDYSPGRAPSLDVFGRLAPGATVEQAQAQMATLGRRAAAASPATHEHLRPRVLPYARSYLDSPELAWMMYLFRLVAGLLLVVIAINVGILIYARTATRAGEIAVRRALGASRARVVVQLFAEALVLCATAAAAGLGLAGLVLGRIDTLVSRLGGAEVPFWWDFRLSPGSVAYAAGLAVLAAAIAGALPALKVTARKVQSSLRELGGGTGMRMGRTWTVLVVAQVAVAVTILPLAVTLGWNELNRIGRPGPGFAAEEILAARIAVDRETPPSTEAEAYEQAFRARVADRQMELARRLEAEPGVRAVTFASHVPGDWAWRAGASGRVELEEPRPDAEPVQHPVSFLQVAPELFEVYGVPVLTGRLFQAADLTGAATAVVANRSFVEYVLGGGEALGRRFRYADTADDLEPGGVERGGWYEIVGVVSDFPRKETPSGRGAPTLYHPASPGMLNPLGIVVRVQGIAPESLAGRVREIATALDPNLRLSRVESVAQLHRERMKNERLLTLAITVATLSVLLLSAAGIHALMAFTVAQRRKEIGIRAALGAQPRRILGSIFARAMRQLALGALLGSLLGGALIVAWDLPAGRSAAVLVGVATIVLGVGLLAALGPARRGLRIEPSEALRAE